MARCENYYHFDNNIKITKVRDNPDTRGFNYLPFYPLQEEIVESYIVHVNKTDSNRTEYDDLVIVYNMDMNTYQQFGKDIYDSPLDGLGKYAQYVIKLVAYKPFIFNLTNDNNVIVIYNPSNIFDKTIHVEKIKLCHTYHSNSNDDKSSNNNNNKKIISNMTTGLVIMGVLIIILMILLLILIVKYKKLVGGNYHLVS